MASVDDGSCAVNDACGVCGGTALAGCTDQDSLSSILAIVDDGSCANAVVEGWYENASNYNPLANVDDNSCVFEDTGSDCPGDLDNDGSVATADLLQFLAFFGQTCQ